MSERTRQRHRELADAVRDLLQQRFTEPLTLEEISAPLGVSPGFLCRVFRRETGATIHGYLMHLRLARAVELLAGGQGKNLTRLGLDLGFASHSHFTRAFCRRFGAPPSVVRARLAPSRARL
jgi:AraC family transcriptional regulator